ncbi:zinc-ribbon domain-containing protein [Desulfoscipio sp. XC116]|uniref:zinc-ribbon domain-containing protein n=1 Tax=Desulfoscipio sp. XC116 TaxID=3144975 RepID=UPI00325BE88C
MQCPNCQKMLQGEFMFCPFCGAQVIKNTTCHTCHKQVDPAWVSCPYCGSDLKAPVQQPMREQPVYMPEKRHQPPHHPPYAHGHHYGSSSAKHYRKRKGFLGRIFSS